MFRVQRSFFRPSYEDFHPRTETKDSPESHLLLIHLPGFAPEHVSAKFESSHKKVKVFGERPLGNNRWRRFSVEHTVPESCEASKLLRKFEAGIVTITMPKKVIGPKEQELTKLPTDQQAAPKPPLSAADHESKASTKRLEEEKATSHEVESQKGKEVISQGPKSAFVDGKKEEAPILQKATTGDSVTQEGQEGPQRKSQIKMDKKNQTDENLTGSFVENGEKLGVERKETKERIEKSISEAEKVQEVIPPKPTMRVQEGKEVKDIKDQEGTKEKLAGSVLENGKNRGAEMKETEEVFGKAAEKVQEVIPPKPAMRVEEGKEIKAQKDQEVTKKNLAGSVLEIGKSKGAEMKETGELFGKIAEKVQEAVPVKPAMRVEEGKEIKTQKDQEVTKKKLAGSVLEIGKNRGAEMKETGELFGQIAEKVQEVIPSKPAMRVEEGKEIKTQKDQEVTKKKLAGSLLEIGKNKGKENGELFGQVAEKVQEVILAKPTTRVEERGKVTVTEVTTPKGRVEKNGKQAGPVSENGKNIGAEKKEKDEVSGKTSKPRDDLLAEKERKEYTKKEKINEGGKGLKDVINFSQGKGTKEKAASSSASASASEAVTKMEEDKQMIFYLAAAAVAVTVTIGLYSAIRSLAFS